MHSNEETDRIFHLSNFRDNVNSNDGRVQKVSIQRQLGRSEQKRSTEAVEYRIVTESYLMRAKPS